MFAHQKPLGPSFRTAMPIRAGQKPSREVSHASRLLLALFLAGAGVSSQAQSDRVVITNAPGFTITWDGNNGGFRESVGNGAGPTNNAALASNGTVPFGSSEYGGGGKHMIVNVNDGFYGNSASWISDFTKPDTNAFIGLNFTRTVAIQSIAWGRDNTTDDAGAGPYVDRAPGIYTLQVTTASNPGVDTPETGNAATGWITLGAVQYKTGTDNKFFTACYRHRFDVAAGGSPISATGIRIKVSDGGICMDEIEVNPGPDPTPALSTYIQIQPAAGFQIEWDGNDGKFSTPASPAPVTKNRALASNGTTAFASSEYGQGVHYATNVIDGLYGNKHSWLSDFSKPGSPTFIGLNFGGAIDIRSVAWSRDNGDDTERTPAGPFTDRALGTYTLQITTAQNPGATTPDTGDPKTGWATVGALTYRAEGSVFVPYLRHRYDLTQTNGSPISATGLRIIVSDANVCIDEIEVNNNLAIERGLVGITPEAGYTIAWDGNNGDFFNSITNGGLASVPDNDALASKGATTFFSSELSAYGHIASKVINGYFGNAQSWIPGPGLPSTDADPFVGVKFGRTVAISSLAWGRDNRGQYFDRSASRSYIIQVTTTANPGVDTQETGDPATGWVPIGTIQYGAAALPDFQPSYRHRFEVAQAGHAISATGLRIKPSVNDTCIDEIEINPAATTVSIIGEPSDVVAVEGGPATFAVTAVVAGVPSPILYQWQRDGVDLAGATNATLVTAPLTAADSGAKFRVQASAKGALTVASREALFTLRASNAAALQDSFTASPLEARKWIVVGGSVTVAGQQAAFVPGSRAILASAGQFSPRIPGGLMIQGRITTLAPGDFSVWTRAASVVDPRTDQPTRKEYLDTGIRFNFRTDGTPALTAQARERSASDGVAFGLVFGSLVIGEASQTWDFAVGDNGTNVSFTVTEVGNPLNTATLVGVSTIRPSSFHVAFDSGTADQFTGLPALVTLDEVLVTSLPTTLKLQPAAGYALGYDGNSGAFYDVNAPAPAPLNPASSARGASAFGSSELGGSYLIANVNDGFYGASNSWVANYLAPDPNPFVGVKFASTVAITNLAWSRDNTGNPDLGGTNRAVGVYTLQVTRVATPGSATPETGDPATGWATVGAVEYQAGPLFVPHLRHRFELSAGAAGAPVEATGIRIKVSSSAMAIDELEVNVTPVAERQNEVMRVQVEAGYQLAWDGNDGQFSGAQAPLNAGLASQGAVAIGSGELGLGIHLITAVNDGKYGNAYSWISGVDNPDPFIGLKFPQVLSLTNIAWSRDNTPNPPYLDRSLGTYIIQVTTAASVSADTQETGDPATGWATVATLQYLKSVGGFFRSYARHRFDASKNGAPILARGVRIKVPNGSGYGGTDLDELEVNTPVPATLPGTLSLQRQANSVTISWTGGGVLQSADTVAGAWADVTGASNPYVAVPSGAQKFYRLRQQ